MLQAASTGLFNPLVSKALLFNLQANKSQGKLVLRIFFFAP